MPLTDEVLPGRGTCIQHVPLEQAGWPSGVQAPDRTCFADGGGHGPARSVSTDRWASRLLGGHGGAIASGRGFAGTLGGWATCAVRWYAALWFPREICCLADDQPALTRRERALIVKKRECHTKYGEQGGLKKFSNNMNANMSSESGFNFGRLKPPRFFHQLVILVLDGSGSMPEVTRMQLARAQELITI